MPTTSKRKRARKARLDHTSMAQGTYSGDSCNAPRVCGSRKKNRAPVLLCGRDKKGIWQGSLEKTLTTPVMSGLSRLDYLSPLSSGLFARVPDPAPTGPMVDRLHGRSQCS